MTFINGHIHKRLCPAQVPWPSTKLWEVGGGTGHRTKRSPIQTGRCLFAVASFMLALLALIGLKKFRSFQKPNRIARTFDAFDGRRDTKQGVSGPALEWRGGPQSFGTSGGPEAKKGRWKILDLSATLVNSWPPDCNVFLSLSRVSIWRFAAWSATSQLPIGIFLGINFPISRPIFEGPSAHNSHLKQAISPTPEFAGIWRSGDDATFRSDPTFTRASPGLRS